MELDTLIAAFRDVVRPHLERSDSARALADSLGRWLIAEAERAASAQRQSDRGSDASPAHGTPATPGTPDAPGAPDSPQAQAAPAASAQAEQARGAVVVQKAGTRGIVPLKIGDATVHLAVQGATEDLGRARQAAAVRDEEDESPRSRSFAGLDLSLIATRCRLKAASCRLYIERRAAMGDAERERPVLARMEAMIAEAKAMRDCFLWAFWRERPAPPDETLRVIARCYDALADSSSLVERLDAMGDRASRDELPLAMQQMATASSALRIALQDTWMTSPDVDQEESHLWLRRESFTRRIFIRRNMALSDPADPLAAESLITEVAALLREVESRSAARAGVEKAFKRLEYHARRAANAPNAPDEHDLRKIAETIATLRDSGVRESDTRYSEALPPAVATILASHPSAEVAEVASRVLGRSDRASDEETEDERPREWSERVVAVREMLVDRRMVVIGGEPRPDAIARMRDAFGVREVDWVRLTEHGTGEPMRAPIQRAETSVVVVIIKLAGHLHADEARAYASEAGKPCVSLPGGYNPEQIADAILQQASDRLRAAT